MNERIAVVEAQVKEHDSRLNRHDEKITDLQTQNVRQDTKLDNLCKLASESKALSEDIHGAVKTVKWIVSGATALIGLWVAVKQLGLF